jgi:filamentous hemagglutinin
VKFRRPSIPRRTSSALPIAAGSAILLAGLGADGGDILRGGSFQKGGKGGNRPAVDTPTPAAADTARANARDSLARTSQALKAMQRMQEAARANAAKGPAGLGNHPLKPGVKLPNVPDGLKPGGLVPLGGAKNPSSWVGAKAPEETIRNGKTEVDILQTQRQALLEWETFHLGKDTTLNFNQSRGGENAAQWIAFNKVKDPAANPSQILGRIKADGQVYLINPNGVIFGGASQVNTRGLTVSSLPINDNLVSQGLLNNRDAQFLFSALKVPGGSDGTPDFNPQAPPATGRFGDITVLPGAVIETPASSAGSGGRVMLVAPNVHQKGSILTPSGQTVLAAGLQVGIAAHDANDPSLRGLDVWVGAVDADSGTVNQEGLLQFHEGSASLTGKSINQFGVLESTTTVSLNGRIDINASYGAAANPNFDSGGPGSGGPMFLNQFTGVATFGKNSSVRILPVTEVSRENGELKEKRVPGTQLPESSQVNVTGLAVHLDESAIVFAPGGDITMRAGNWTYRDPDGDGTIFDAAGNPEAFLATNYTGPVQRFFFDAGQVFIDKRARVSAAGSVDVAVAADQTLLGVRLLGSELADSPLQRNSSLRGKDLVVDLRETGSYEGRFWIGTPLGDVTGLAGLITRNAAQLTAEGGSITVTAGSSFVLRESADLDVSGGFFNHEAGSAPVSRLVKDGRLVKLRDATPDQNYNDVFTGVNTIVHEKWGIKTSYSTPLIPGLTRGASLEGAPGGTLSITAPAMAIDGKLRGSTLVGSEQADAPALPSSLSLAFEGRKRVIGAGGTPNYIPTSPFAPSVSFTRRTTTRSKVDFTLNAGQPPALPADRSSNVELPTDIIGPDGFGKLSVTNPEGSILVPDAIELETLPGGSISLAAGNISVLGDVSARGGSLSFTAFNVSPSFLAEYLIISPPPQALYPAVAADRGKFLLGPNASLDTAGVLQDLRNPSGLPYSTKGGSVTIRSFNAELAKGSSVNVSGGALVSERGDVTFGQAGSITIASGNDPGFPGVTGGSISLQSELEGFSGSKGGSLSLQASRVRIGSAEDPEVLTLDPAFFSNGGFTRFQITGIGARSSATPPAGLTESYRPAVSIAAGVQVTPVATGLAAKREPDGDIRLVRKLADPGVRQAVNLSFQALGNDDPFTLDSLEIRGDIVTERDSSIRTEAGGAVSFKAGTITLLGEIETPAGAITVTGASSFPMTTDQRPLLRRPLATVHIGSSASLSAPGAVVLKPDAFGRRIGTALAGGSVSISGNIVAEKGALIDVSGISTTLDFDPSSLASGMSPAPTQASGLLTKPMKTTAVSAAISTNGGSIDLSGSQLLMSDATLLSRAGGGGAVGGRLTISSGRYYNPGDTSTGADINLVVSQRGDSIRPQSGPIGVGYGIEDPLDAEYGLGGRFSLKYFRNGDFQSLDLGGKYVSAGGPVPYGGNLHFEGDVSLKVPGELRIAGGGVIRAEGAVEISAAYVSIGQAFRAPSHPDDIFYPFQKAPSATTPEHNFAPTHGSGALSVSAGLIDIGTLSLLDVGTTGFSADAGEIRGNGILSAAGELTLSSSGIQPTTLSPFEVFVYDYAGGTGRINTIRNGPAGETPVSAGGSVSLYATSIRHAGNIKAPLGSITLGWDGTDRDPSDADIDAPRNSVVGATLASPVTNQIIIDRRARTSVSGLSDSNKDPWLAPFGISQDGKTWIDPRGVNITLSGIQDKSVAISGESVSVAVGSVTDIRGGGDLQASRWVRGSGGSVDILGVPRGPWNAGTTYETGTLVTHGGETWSARLAHSNQTPAVGPYWSKVATSYAIVPESKIPLLPFNSFNTEGNASLLEGDPGFVSSTLRIGDTITLEQSAALPAGSYVLLPARYALLPGAFLVTPKTTSLTSSSVRNAEGAFLVKGYAGNEINGAPSSPIRSVFEVAPAKVYNQRASYESLTANSFLPEAAKAAEATVDPVVPVDGGYAAFHGNSALRLAGKLRASAPGLGSVVDVSSFADITISSRSAAPKPGGVSIDSSVLDSWKAGSLLVGGLRRTNTAGETVVSPRTSSITLANEGAKLSGTDLILGSLGSVTTERGSALKAVNNESFAADPLLVEGGGAILRASADAAASVTRPDPATSAASAATIAGGSILKGASLIIDSTNNTSIAAGAKLGAESMSLASGLISIVLDGGSAPGPSAVEPHLILQGDALARSVSADHLSLYSYGTIDFHGAGVFGSKSLDSLTLSASGIRGFAAAGPVTIRAGSLTMGNPRDSAASTAAATTANTLKLEAGRIDLAANRFTVSGFPIVEMTATEKVVSAGSGQLSIVGDLTATTPLITGAAGSDYEISSTGAMLLTRPSGAAASPAVSPADLGASLAFTAAHIKADTSVLLPAGNLELSGRDGVEVGGTLSAAGASRDFGDLIRQANAGNIRLESTQADVRILAGALLDVDGAPEGGNAGGILISAPAGSFLAAGDFSGEASAGAKAGDFSLDAGSLPATGASSLTSIARAAAAGGFDNSLAFRIRKGDASIDSRIVARSFSLTADDGSVTLRGSIDASGETGGSATLAASGDLVLAPGSSVSVAAERFDNAGKGGSVLLEAGAQTNGVADPAARLDIQAGSFIDLSVAEFVAGSWNQPGSSAFDGKFTGILHLRAPRNAAGTDLGIETIAGSVTGASSITAEGYRIYQPAGGILNIALRNQIHADNTAFLGAAGTAGVHETAIRGRLLGANPGLDPLLVIAPGVEIINTAGDLALGLANTAGSTNAEALAAADWDLSSFRYGSKSAPGVLTMRAAGDLVFNNTLSDGFTPIAQGSAPVFSDNGNSLMWLATLAPIRDTLPVNAQSWSYRLTAGADLTAADFRSVLSEDRLDALHPSKGSVLVGEFHPVVPNNQTNGIAAGIGTNGQTADTIRISTTTANRGTRFETIRTGAGEISISAGRDIRLRNPFASVYTAGVAIPDPTRVLDAGDFVVPYIPSRLTAHPSQTVDGTLGAIQQIYQPVWSMAGGNISISATGDIGRYNLVNGEVTPDSSRQMPTNWLYRRGFVNPTTGLFASDGGFGDVPNVNNPTNLTDSATSTTWWIDFSNFFQGIGTLGGGNISLEAGRDVVNIDAVAPTNARMAGREKNPAFGSSPEEPEYLNLAPAASRLVEHGGGDVSVVSGRNIDGGIYYVERGDGTLTAGGAITTNAARSPSLGILDGSQPLDPLTWMPTALFVGKSSFNVSARGSVLLGPVSNPFLMPQGLNNKYWYKTYFSTYSPDAEVNVTALGGDLTFRTEVNLPEGSSPESLLGLWFRSQNFFNGLGAQFNASHYQPWLRLAELDLATFAGAFDFFAPSLRGTSLGGDVRIAGDITLAPAPRGNLELVASGAISGLNPVGPGRANGTQVMVWTSSSVNVSDADPSLLPTAVSPLAYQVLTGRSQRFQFKSDLDILEALTASLEETGSYVGEAGTQQVKSSLHARDILHHGDRAPVRIRAAGGDITGLTLFSPKLTEVLARRDISDVALYLQNTSAGDVSLVSAGRSIVPYNETSAARILADNILTGNFVGDQPSPTVAGAPSKALAGDIRISGPGVLEVLAGRNIDLGTGPNFSDGTGTGITSIGNLRNPFLPFGGADLVVLAGITSADGKGPAGGLANGSMNIDGFLSRYLTKPDRFSSRYLASLGDDVTFEDLSAEQQALVALEKLFRILKDTGRKAVETGDYKPGYRAISALFGKDPAGGDILARAREIRTTNGGAIAALVPGGGISMASEILGNPLTPPGVVTEYGGPISTLTQGDVDLGQARVFTLRGGDIVMWSSEGNIAAGTSPRTVVTAPPTRVVFDSTSASVQTDLGGLATGGGIGVLAAVEGIKPGNVDLIAPKGFVDAGDAGIRVTGNLNIAANTVINAGNISAGGNTTGASVAVSAAPSVAVTTSAASASAATTSAAPKPAEERAAPETQPTADQGPSLFTVEVIGYGGGAAEEEEDQDAESDEQGSGDTP